MATSALRELQVRFLFSQCVCRRFLNICSILSVDASPTSSVIIFLKMYLLLKEELENVVMVEVVVRTSTMMSTTGPGAKEQRCSPHCDPETAGHSLPRTTFQYLLLAVILTSAGLILLTCFRSLFLAFYQNFVLRSSSSGGGSCNNQNKQQSTATTASSLSSLPASTN